MRRITVSLLVVAMVVTGLLLYAHRVQAVNVVQPKGKTHTTNQTSIGKPKPQSEYDRALANYLSITNKEDPAQKTAAVERRRKAVEQYNKKDAELSKSLSKISDDLRKSSQTRSRKKLDFDGAVPEREWLIPTSSASAHLFTTLYGEGLVDGSELMSMLSHEPQMLSSEWAHLIKDIAASSGQYPVLPRLCIQTLYAMGVSQKAHRRAMETWITDQRLDCPSTVEMLLFKIDDKDGQRIPVNTPENLALANKVLGIKDGPEMRVVAAEYFADIREIKKAEDALVQIMWQPYKGINKGDKLSRDIEVADGQLYRARVHAMSVLFSKVRTERSFREIYDRSNMGWADGRDESKVPREWRGVSGYSAGELEIECAKSLIDQVRGKQ
jgi:hypothetical protein